jgi:hypothetical protein
MGACNITWPGGTAARRSCSRLIEAIWWSGTGGGDTVIVPPMSS